jgi:hypothetical protein
MIRPLLRLSKGGRRWGAHASTPKASDLGFPAKLVHQVGALPPRAFLTGAIGLVKDQKTQGSCTGHATTSMAERLFGHWMKQILVFSPAYTYYMERLAEGTLSQGDCGADVDTGLIVSDPKSVTGNGLDLSKVTAGLCLEIAMPYKDSDFVSAPSAAAIASAKLYPAGAYHSLGGGPGVIANIKLCILSNYSACIGISVFDSFDDPAVETSGLIPYPNVNVEKLQGGHDMHGAIGYDDAIQCPNSPNPGAVMVQNSWGTDWGIVCPLSGERGFAWLPYDYLMNMNMTSDVRMQHLGKAW